MEQTGDLLMLYSNDGVLLEFSYLSAVWKIVEPSLNHVIFFGKLKPDDKWVLVHIFGLRDCKADELDVKSFVNDNIHSDEKHQLEHVTQYVDAVSGVAPTPEMLELWKKTETSKTEGQEFPVATEVQHFEIYSSDPKIIADKLSIIQSMELNNG